MLGLWKLDVGTTASAKPLLFWIWSYYNETTTNSEKRKSSTSATSRHVLLLSLGRDYTTNLSLVLLLAALKRRKGKV
jgi:hypothetical protein